MKKIFLLAGLVLSLNAIAQVPSYVPTTGLVSWYPFNGNANDGSGNGNNGTVINSTLTTDRNSFANSSYDFDFTNEIFGQQNDEIYIPYNSILNSTNISVSVWLYPRSYYWSGNPSSSAIIRRFEYGYSNPNGQAWGIDFTQNSIYAFILEASTNNTQNNAIATYASPLVLNTWNNIVFTYNGSLLNLFLNGILVGSTNTALLLNTAGTSGISIGESNQANGFWQPTDGKIDDIGIWNRALTQTEISALYNGCTNASITSGATTICGTGSILLTANANTSYQWKKNNVVIAGATNQTYSANATGSYTVTANSACNTTSTSNAIQINKYALPTCTITANGATSFCTGGSVTLAAITNAGAGALYQWYKGATVISGATNSSYVATTASTYKCKVTKPSTGCSKTSAGIVVTLHDPTASITASGPLTFCVGGSVLFTAVTNAGVGALYQWYKNSTGLAGATNSTYTATLAGNYVVVVTNSYGCTKASGIKKVIINCRLEEGISESFYVSPNPCSTCFINGDMNDQDLIFTDIVGRKINVQFIKSENGFYINLPENDKGIFLIRNIKTGDVVKFVKE